MCSQLLICMIINPCTESLLFLFCDLTWKCIGIAKFFCLTICSYRKKIRRNLSSWNHNNKISCLILLLHGIFLISHYHFCTFCFREKSLDKHSVFCQPGCHNIFGRCLFSIYNSLNSRPVHIFIYFIIHASASISLRYIQQFCFLTETSLICSCLI